MRCSEHAFSHSGAISGVVTLRSDISCFPALCVYIIGSLAVADSFSVRLIPLVKGWDMIIECTQCQKQYHLEEAKITSEGITIRCTQCRTTFLVRSYSGLNTGNGPQAIVLPTDQVQTEAMDVSGPIESGIPDSAYEEEDEISYAEARAVGACERLSPPSQDRVTLTSESLSDSVSVTSQPSLERSNVGLSSSNNIVEGVGLTRKQKGLIRSSWIYLCVLIVFLAGIGLVAGYHTFRGKIPLSETAAYFASKLNAPFRSVGSEKGSIQLSELNGYFITRGKDNRIFVIEGKATNGYSAACSFLQLTGLLFNEKGEVTARESGYCGNIFNLKELQTYSKKIIEDKLSNAYGTTLSNLNLEPNQSLPFMLVFFDPPLNVSEYSVEVLDFKTSHSRNP